MQRQLRNIAIETRASVQHITRTNALKGSTYCGKPLESSDVQSFLTRAMLLSESTSDEYLPTCEPCIRKALAELAGEQADRSALILRLRRCLEDLQRAAAVGETR